MVYELDHIRDALDPLKDVYFVVSLCLGHPTIFQRIFFPIYGIPNAVTYRSAAK
jgi:hypothetical protein